MKNSKSVLKSIILSAAFIVICNIPTYASSCLDSSSAITNNDGAYTCYQEGKTTTLTKGSADITSQQAAQYEKQDDASNGNIANAAQNQTYHNDINGEIITAVPSITPGYWNTSVAIHGIMNLIELPDWVDRWNITREEWNAILLNTILEDIPTTTCPDNYTGDCNNTIRQDIVDMRDAIPIDSRVPIDGQSTIEWITTNHPTIETLQEDLYTNDISNTRCEDTYGIGDSRDGDLIKNDDGSFTYACIKDDDGSLVGQITFGCEDSYDAAIGSDGKSLYCTKIDYAYETIPDDAVTTIETHIREVWGIELTTYLDLYSASRGGGFKEVGGHWIAISYQYYPGTSSLIYYDTPYSIPVTIPAQIGVADAWTEYTDDAIYQNTYTSFVGYRYFIRSIDNENASYDYTNGAGQHYSYSNIYYNNNDSKYFIGYSSNNASNDPNWIDTFGLTLSGTKTNGKVEILAAPYINVNYKLYIKLTTQLKYMVASTFSKTYSLYDESSNISDIMMNTHAWDDDVTIYSGAWSLADGFKSITMKASQTLGTSYAQENAPSDVYVEGTRAWMYDVGIRSYAGYGNSLENRQAQLNSIIDKYVTPALATYSTRWDTNKNTNAQNAYYPDNNNYNFLIEPNAEITNTFADTYNFTGKLFSSVNFTNYTVANRGNFFNMADGSYTIYESSIGESYGANDIYHWIKKQYTVPPDVFSETPWHLSSLYCADGVPTTDFTLCPDNAFIQTFNYSIGLIK